SDANYLNIVTQILRHNGYPFCVNCHQVDSLKGLNHESFSSFLKGLKSLLSPAKGLKSLIFIIDSISCSNGIVPNLASQSSKPYSWYKYVRDLLQPTDIPDGFNCN